MEGFLFVFGLCIVLIYMGILLDKHVDWKKPISISPFGRKNSEQIDHILNNKVTSFEGNAPHSSDRKAIMKMINKDSPIKNENKT